MTSARLLHITKDGPQSKHKNCIVCLLEVWNLGCLICGSASSSGLNIPRAFVT